MTPPTSTADEICTNEDIEMRKGNNNRDDEKFKLKETADNLLWVPK